MRTSQDDAHPPSPSGCWLFNGQLPKEGKVRVSTAFNRLLGLEGAWVRGVRFAEEGVVVEIALRRRRRVCGGCGSEGEHLGIHGRRRKRWRHLDLGAQRCFVECELRRLRCPHCRGVRYEDVPFARPEAAFTSDFEDVAAHLAQQMAKSPICRLLRIGWSALGGIIERAVGERLGPRRLENLILIGVDEVSWRRHHRYLTCVIDHLGGRVVWAAEGRNAETLAGFFDQLGAGKQTIMAVSIDMSGGYEKAIREAIPHARICFDPFHVTQLAQRAVDQVRRDEWNRHERSATPEGRWIKGTRWALLKAPANRTEGQELVLAEVQRLNKRIYRAYLLKEELRALYGPEVGPERAARHLDDWLGWASRSKLPAFVKLARTVRRHREGIIDAVRIGLSNGRVEGLNSKIRLLSNRSFGFHSPGPLIALVYLCCGGIEVELPR